MKEPSALAITARKFLRAADLLVNAQERLQKHEAGSKGRAKAIPVYGAASAGYDYWRAELVRVLAQEAK